MIENPSTSARRQNSQMRRFRSHRAHLAFLLILLPVIPLAGVAPDPAPAPRETENEDPITARAFEQLESGRAGAALDQFEAALLRNPGSIPALMGRAMAYSQMGRHEKAISSYDSVLDRAPDYAFAWNGRGLAAYSMGKFGEALDAFRKATADRPVNGMFYEALAWTHMCRGSFGEAADSAQQATLMYGRTGRKNLYPLLIAYFSHLEAGETEKAERALRYARSNRTHGEWPSPVIDYLLGKIEAPELISRVTNFAEETEARTYIGLHLRHAEKYEEAARQLHWVAEKGDRRVFEHKVARVLGDFPKNRSVAEGAAGTMGNNRKGSIRMQ